MQAIQSKFLPATNYKGSRISVRAARGRVIVDYPHHRGGLTSADQAHIYAVEQACIKWVETDYKLYHQRKDFIQSTRPRLTLAEYKAEQTARGWLRKTVCGQLPDGSYAHVFI